MSSRARPFAVQPVRRLGRPLAGAALIATVLLASHAVRPTPAAAHARAARGVDVTNAPTVEYVVGLVQPQTQMLEMAIIVPPTGDDAVTLILPAWRPGRYEILDPAGTVREMVAISATGDELAVTKTAKARWRIDGTGGNGCTVRYRVYANSIGNRTRHVDDTHAFLSPSSCFVYAEGLRDAPIRVRVEAPDDWHVATGLAPADGEPADDPRAVVADDYDQLADSPLEIGEHRTLRFESAGLPHEIVVWPPDVAFDADVLVADTKAIVDESIAIFGTVPYERYVFLVHVGAGGGGTEHVNSTIMQTRVSSLEGTFDRSSGYVGYLGLTAHEFFHTWNVKQFRPVGIKPYDYERENYTELLWVAEGTTSYYDEVLPVRAGITETGEYLRRLGDTVNSLRDRPGRRIQSLEASSFDAWIKFNARTPDDLNCTVSFYSGGAVASLALDLAIRRATGGERSMDEVMRVMWERFPLDAPGYSTDDFKAVLAEVAGRDFDAFFDRHISGTEQLPLEDLLTEVGVELYFDAANDDDDDESEEDGEHTGQSEHDHGGHDGHGHGEHADADRELPVRPWLGVNLRDEGGIATVRSVRIDGPAYGAGLIAGDQVLALDGRRLTAGNLDALLERRSPGDAVELTIFRRDRLRTIRMDIAARPDGRWRIRRMDEPTAEQEAAFEDWLGPRAG